MTDLIRDEARMTVKFTIVKSPPGVSLSEEHKSFGPEGGLIGRGADNDWVLSDPERFLSSKHCKVSKEGEGYYLTDLSTNGTFVNASPEPVGRGARVALNDGDNIDIGDYRFKVALEALLDDFPGSPFADSAPAATEPGSGPAFGESQPSPESMHMSSDYGGSVGDIAPDALKVSDPLVALDKAERGLDSDTPAAVKDPFALGGSQEDSADLLQEAAQWPEVKEESSVLPDDWDEDISLLGPRQARDGSARESKPGAATPDSAQSLPSDDSLIVKRSSLQSKPAAPAPGRQGRGTQSGARSQPRSRSADTGAKPAQSKAQASAARRTTGRRESGRDAPKAAAGSVDRSLLEALGLAHSELSDEQVREIHATVGTMMRETLEGLMQVLRSRASIKNEFRMNMTTIQPVENNPIKFSASSEEVLDIMFLRQSRAYKAPVDAVQESFNTIADHQVAMIAGIRSAFKAAMTRFDPLVLEEEFKQSGKGSLVPGLNKGKFWSAYQAHYQQVVNNMERSFQEMFGDEFVQAYEDQLRKLASARKRDE